MAPRPVVIALIASIALATGFAFGQGFQDSPVGPQPDGSILVPTNQRVTPAGAQVNVNGRPLVLAVRPDQKTAAVLLSGAKGPGAALVPVSPVVIIDITTGAVKQQFTSSDPRGSYDGLIYSADGTKLFFSQDDGVVTIADVAEDGTLTLNRQITLPLSPLQAPAPANDPILPASSTGVNNGGMALSSDQNTLYVVFNSANTLGGIDLATNAITNQIPVGNAPKSIVIDGGFAYVTNEGGRAARAKDFTVPSDDTPIVADKDSAASTTGTVSIVSLTKQTVRNVAVGLHPTAILASHGYIFVTNTNSDSISIIDAESGRVVRTTRILPFEGAPFGSSPNGLAMTSRDELVVTPWCEQCGSGV